MNNFILPFYRRPKYQLLGAFAVFQFLYILLAVITASSIHLSAILATIGTFGFGLAILAWCRFDSRERGYPLSAKFPYAVVIFGTLSLIFYFFRSRGFAGGLIALSLSIAFLIGIVIIDLIVATIAIILISAFTKMPIAG